MVIKHKAQQKYFENIINIKDLLLAKFI